MKHFLQLTRLCKRDHRRRQHFRNSTHIGTYNIQSAPVRKQHEASKQDRSAATDSNKVPLDHSPLTLPLRATRYKKTRSASSSKRCDRGSARPALGGGLRRQEAQLDRAAERRRSQQTKHAETESVSNKNGLSICTPAMLGKYLVLLLHLF